MSNSLIEHRYIGEQTQIGDFHFQDIGQVHYLDASDLHQVIWVGCAGFIPNTQFETVFSSPEDVKDIQRFRKDWYFGEIPPHFRSKVQAARELYRQYRESLRPSTAPPAAEPEPVQATPIAE